jgi:hypothetical protein
MAASDKEKDGEAKKPNLEGDGDNVVEEIVVEKEIRLLFFGTFFHENTVS